MIPRATYRLQLHQGFTFADAEAIVPYLADLGISHAYLSPITAAASGSTHGYDVVDPTRINPELGGEAGFRSLVAVLRERGMGVVIDIVPNHMGVAGAENAWWNDVLANGRDSAFADVFDIDWRHDIVLPVLGDPLPKALADGAIVVEEDAVVAYGEHRFPLRPEDKGTTDPVEEVLERQHYRLAWWRTADDELNWRRFFTVNELAGVRVGDPAVFERTHALFFRLWVEGLIDGVRVDHVDGLTDPAGYCRALRARFEALPREDGVPAIIWIEKILGAGEPLASDWGVDGTSGYDFMEEVAALLHDPAGEAPLGEAWAALSGRTAEFAPEELQARQDELAWQFEGQLKACVRAFAALAASDEVTASITPEMLRRAIERLLWVFPVYRTYGTGSDAPASDEAIRADVRARVDRFVPPGEGFAVDAVLAWLAGEGPGDPELAHQAVRRFQQLSAPVAAKGVEDTAFYRYGRLLSRNDVGFDAERFAGTIEEFQASMAARAADWPRALLATATHDHKRGEDVRARLAVLSEVPELWLEHVARWNGLAGAALEGVDPADAYMLYQTLFGAWPDRVGPEQVGPEDLAGFGERVGAWQQKALREGKLRSSWEAPDEAYEARCRTLVDALLGSAEFVTDMGQLLQATAGAARANSLAQVALRCTVPGVPDCYQGTELADLSLVDPDNRRPVDYDERRRLLAEGGAEKLALLAELLALRREHPVLFAHGDYRPVGVTGARAGHVLAFERRHEGAVLRCAVGLRLAGCHGPDWWGDTRVGWGEQVGEMFGERSVHVSTRA